VVDFEGLVMAATARMVTIRCECGAREWYRAGEPPPPCRRCGPRAAPEASPDNSADDPGLVEGK
jgi:hypothetical protein